MQAGGEDFLAACVAQLAVQLAGQALRFAGVAVGEQFEFLEHVAHAEQQRARHRRMQHEQLGDALGRDGGSAIDLAIDLEGRHRTQQRAPLVEVGDGVFAAARFHDVELGVEDARGVVGALQLRAEADEVVALVLQQRAEDGTAKQRGAHLHPVEEFRRAVVHALLVALRAQVEPGGIEGFPHLGGDRAAHGMRVLARGAQAGEQRRWVVGVGDEEVQHRVGAHRIVAGEVRLLQAVERDQRLPVAVGGFGRLHQRQAPGDVEQAGEVFGALDQARHPEQVVGGTAQHGRVSAGRRKRARRRAGRGRALIVRAPRCPWCRRPARSSPPANPRAAPPA